MELVIVIAILAVGLVWYFNAQKGKKVAKSEAEAPYKVEAPKVVEIKPAAFQPMVAEAAPVAEKAPAKTTKAKKPAAKKAKPAAEKATTAPAKKTPKLKRSK